MYERPILFISSHQTREQLFYRPISPDNSVALRTAAKKGKLLITLPKTAELPWLKSSRIPEGVSVIHDPNLSLIDRTANGVRSDIGELELDWGRGIYTINTLRAQAALGWIGGKQIKLSDVQIVAKTRMPRSRSKVWTITPLARPTLS